MGAHFDVAGTNTGLNKLCAVGSFEVEVDNSLSLITESCVKTSGNLGPDSIATGGCRRAYGSEKP